MNGNVISTARLNRVILDGDVPTNLPPFIEADREQAVADLAAANHFAPLIGTDKPGPYALHLSILEGRLIFDVRDTGGVPLTAVGLPAALDPVELRRRLWEEYRIEIAVTERPTPDGLADVAGRQRLLRVSTHFYNTPEEVDRLAEAMRKLLDCSGASA